MTTMSEAEYDAMESHMDEMAAKIEALGKERDELREALRHLAYAISPNMKTLEPDWRVLSYEAHFCGAMEMARKALKAPVDPVSD